MSSPRQWMIFVEWDASIGASQLVVMTNKMRSMGQGAGGTDAAAGRLLNTHPTGMHVAS
jgi:hypothetical protein